MDKELKRSLGMADKIEGLRKKALSQGAVEIRIDAVKTPREIRIQVMKGGTK